VTEEQIQSFWQAHQFGGTTHPLVRDREDFALDDLFRDHDRKRYQACPQLLRRLNSIPLEGKRVLQIGIAEGADSEQLIRRGAIWSGLDPAEESIRHVAKRLDLRLLPYEGLRQGSPSAIPYEPESFDLVFSHTALSSALEIDRVQREIARVLKPGGEFIAVLYAKWSLNYLLSKFKHAAGDGQTSSGLTVYDLRSIRRVFSRFRLMYASKMFIQASPVPASILRVFPGESFLGWWLWAHLRRQP